MQESTPGRPTSNVFLDNAAIYLSCGLLICGALFGSYYLGLHHRHGARAVAVPAVSVLPSIENIRPPQAIAPPAAGELIGKESIADAAQSVAPSVVNIDSFSQVIDPVASAVDSEFLFNGSRMVPFQNLPLTPKLQKAGIGSGLIIRPDGYILTNNHVVKDSGKLTITLADHRSFVGKVIGRDSLSDLALIKIPAVGLPAARLGTSKNLRPGEWAIAIGSPLGLAQSVTHGIISAIGRSVADVNSEVSFIQTDTPINPGNSGGPLINLDGEVIGINSFIRSDAQNIGFATPIDTAKSISQELMTRGRVERSWVGMRLSGLNAELKKRFGLPQSTHGVMVTSIVAGSPAEKDGLQSGDIIQQIDGQPVDSVKEVQQCVRVHKPCDCISLSLLRGGASVTVKLTLKEMPELD